MKFLNLGKWWVGQSLRLAAAVQYLLLTNDRLCCRWTEYDGDGQGASDRRQRQPASVLPAPVQRVSALRRRGVRRRRGRRVSGGPGLEPFRRRQLPDRVRQRGQPLPRRPHDRRDPGEPAEPSRARLPPQRVGYGRRRAAR